MGSYDSPRLAPVHFKPQSSPRGLMVTPIWTSPSQASCVQSSSLAEPPSFRRNFAMTLDHSCITFAHT